MPCCIAGDGEGVEKTASSGTVEGDVVDSGPGQETDMVSLKLEEYGDYDLKYADIAMPEIDVLFHFGEEDLNEHNDNKGSFTNIDDLETQYCCEVNLHYTENILIDV